MTFAGNKFVVMTGPYVPFSVNKGLRTNGIGVDTMEVIMKMTDIPFDRKNVKFVKWDRAYKEAAVVPGRVLINVNRTPELESKFKWVGPVDFPELVLITKKDADITINSIEDVAKYKVGAIRGSDAANVLLERGLPASKLDQCSTYVQPLMGLKKGTLDMVAFSDMGATFLMKMMRMDKDDYKVVYSYKKVPLYFAFCKKTDDATIKLLNDALETYKKPSATWISAFDKNVVKYLPYGVVE